MRWDRSEEKEDIVTERNEGTGQSRNMWMKVWKGILRQYGNHSIEDTDRYSSRTLVQIVI